MTRYVTWRSPRSTIDCIQFDYIPFFAHRLDTNTMLRCHAKDASNLRLADFGKVANFKSLSNFCVMSRKGVRRPELLVCCGHRITVLVFRVAPHIHVHAVHYWLGLQ